MPHRPVDIKLSLVSRLIYAEDNVNIASESECAFLLLPKTSMNLLKNTNKQQFPQQESQLNQTRTDETQQKKTAP